jgi:hypothetical protein
MLYLPGFLVYRPWREQCHFSMTIRLSRYSSSHKLVPARHHSVPSLAGAVPLLHDHPPIQVQQLTYTCTGPASWCTVPGGSSVGFLPQKSQDLTPIGLHGCFFSAVDPDPTESAFLKIRWIQILETRKIYYNKTKKKCYF